MNTDAPAASKARAAARSPGAWATLLVSAVLGVAVDLWSKSAAFERVADGPVTLVRDDVLALPPGQIGRLVPAHEAVVAVPGALHFQLVLNPGAVFGVGPGRRWVFILFTGIALAFALFVFARWTTARSRVAHAAIGLVIAGGVGNLYDRVVFGCVRDFLRWLPGTKLPFGLAWPGGANEVWPWVSNVADALLLIGIAALVIYLWRADPGTSQKKQAGDGAAQPTEA